MAITEKVSLLRLEALEMWQWPPDAKETLLATLAGASPEDRARAASLLHAIVDDEVAGALIAKLLDPEEADEVRAAAAIALGPALESADADELAFADEEPLSLAMAERMAESLERVYSEASVPALVRRRALEAAVRAPREWHAGAVRAAWASGDPDWRTTAVFCMGYVRGFEDVVRDVFSSGDERLVAEAVKAASMSEGIARLVEPALVRLARSSEDRDVQLHAIGALGGATSKPSLALLHELADSRDEEIADVAQEALVMRGVLSDLQGLDF